MLFRKPRGRIGAVVGDDDNATVSLRVRHREERTNASSDHQLFVMRRHEKYQPGHWLWVPSFAKYAARPGDQTQEFGQKRQPEHGNGHEDRAYKHYAEHQRPPTMERLAELAECGSRDERRAMSSSLRIALRVEWVSVITHRF